MKLCFIFVVFFTIAGYCNVYSQDQQVDLNLKDASYSELFNEIHRQTGVRFVYNTNQMTRFTSINLVARKKSIREVLDEVLTGTSLSYIYENDVVMLISRQDQDQVKSVTIKGRVTDEKKNPIPGVTILVKGTLLGTSTDVNGKFSFSIPEMENTILLFTFIGLKAVELPYKGQEEVNVVMTEDQEELSEVVVVSTGMFERNLNTFTGSVSSYKGDELHVISSQNVLEALKSIDPSFVITPNNQYGSDPNRMPDVSIRGKTGVINFGDEFANDPNVPLFVLDGLEVPLSAIVNLSMDRVESVSVLKDASATSLYGSRAANGVLVIETKRPAPGKLDIQYSGSMSLSFPDLSVYNMMNAAEKLEFERLSGVYWHRDVSSYYFQLEEIYNRRLNWIKSGVDTYWLSEPVRTGVTHRHDVQLSGGAPDMYYMLALNYAGEEGVMKKSGNDRFGASIRLNYKSQSVTFYNDFTFSYRENENTPVEFSKFVQTNPYYRKDVDGVIEPFLDTYALLNSEMKPANPLYDFHQNYLDKTYDLNLKESARFEYYKSGLRLSARISLEKSMNTSENFKSPFHTIFANTPKSEKGTYVKGTKDNFKYSGDVSANWIKKIADNHLFSLFTRLDFSSNKQKTDSFKAEGFPDDRVPNPSFSRQYASNSKPGYSESLKRSFNWVNTLNYSFKEKYLLDLTFHRNGSTNFGKNRKYTNSWAVGIGWNLHKEPFVGTWADKFKIRGSVGDLGNNNTSYDTALTYRFNTDSQMVFGVGANVQDFPNGELDWQKTIDLNVGMDLVFLKNRVSLTLEWYHKVTDPLIVTVDVSPSTGTGKLVTNMGRSKVNGYSFQSTISLIRKKDLFWNINFMGSFDDTKFSKIGKSMHSFNEELKKTTLKRYHDGSSLYDIWAVRSAGIDPMSGNEMFIKKDGSVSYKYDSDDEVNIGKEKPQLEGTFGTFVSWKGLSMTLYFRYSFGKDIFNTELFNKIENLVRYDDMTNQDKRALYDRWQKVGDRTHFRNINPPDGFTGNYPKTSRYLQKESFLSGESISLRYQVRDQDWMKSFARSITLGATMNDVFRWSTVKQERGIAYPFARGVSFNLSVIFK